MNLLNVHGNTLTTERMEKLQAVCRSEKGKNNATIWTCAYSDHARPMLILRFCDGATVFTENSVPYDYEDQNEAVDHFLSLFSK